MQDRKKSISLNCVRLSSSGSGGSAAQNQTGYAMNVGYICIVFRWNV